MLNYTPCRAVFEGNGVAVDFPFAFKVWDTRQLLVQVTDHKGLLSLAEGWTAKLAEGGAFGGTVHYVHKGFPLPQGYRLSILRNMPFKQEIDLISGTRFDPEVVETGLDQATAERQQLLEAVGRAIKVPPSSEEPPELLADLIFEARDQTLASAGEAAQSATSAATSAEEARTTLEATIKAHDEALLEIEERKSSAIADITHNGEMQVNNVISAGVNLVSTAEQAQANIVTTGKAQEERVKNAGSRAALDVILEGDKQSSRVVSAGNDALLHMRDETSRATQEADRAKNEADRAQNIAGIGPASKQHFGWMRVGSGLRADEDGTVHADIPSFLSLPAVTFPAEVAIGYPAVITMSSATSIIGALVNRFSVVFDGGTALDVAADSAEGGHATLTVTPSGDLDGQLGKVTVTAYDSNNNASNDTELTFTKRIVTHRAPRILSPVQGDVDVSLLPLLTLQEGQCQGMPATAYRTQVQIFRDAECTDTLWDSGEIAYTVSVSCPLELPDGATVYMQAKHEMQPYGWSAYGAVTSCTIVCKTIAAPRIISPALGAVNQALNVAITLDPIATTGYAPQGRYTQLQIFRDEGCTDKVFDTGEAHAYTVSVPTNNLPVNCKIYAQARHNDLRLGWGEFGPLTSFTTMNAYTVAPAIVSPINNTVDVALKPVVTVQPHSNEGPTDVGAETHIQIATDATFGTVVAEYSGVYTTTWTPDNNLPIKAGFSVRARHRGNVWGWSTWGETSRFTTLDVRVHPPVMLSPLEGATNVSLQPVLQMGEPTALNQSIMGVAFNWATKADMSDVQGSGVLPPNQRTFQIPAPLALNTQYYVRAIAEGSITGRGEGSIGDVVGFRTLNTVVNAPTIISPSDGGIVTLSKGRVIVQPNITPSGTDFTTELFFESVETTETFTKTIEGSQINISEAGIPTSFFNNPSKAVTPKYLPIVRICEYKGTYYGVYKIDYVNTLTVVSSSDAINWTILKVIDTKDPGTGRAFCAVGCLNDKLYIYPSRSIYTEGFVVDLITLGVTSFSVNIPEGRAIGCLYVLNGVLHGPAIVTQSTSPIELYSFNLGTVTRVKTLSMQTGPTVRLKADELGVSSYYGHGTSRYILDLNFNIKATIPTDSLHTFSSPMYSKHYDAYYVIGVNREAAYPYTYIVYKLKNGAITSYAVETPDVIGTSNISQGFVPCGSSFFLASPPSMVRSDDECRTFVRSAKLDEQKFTITNADSYLSDFGSFAFSYLEGSVTYNKCIIKNPATLKITARNTATGIVGPLSNTTTFEVGA